jgi:hypothetical protein
MKKTLTIISILAASLPGFSAQLDLQLTLGVLQNNGVNLNNGGLFQIGTFSEYTDGSGTGYFLGKNYDTLRSSFTSLNILDAAPTQTDSSAQFFGSFAGAETPANTRLFGWVFSSTSASSSANWAIVSGTIGGTTLYDQAWLAPAPSALDAAQIELGVTSNLIYASTSGSALVPNTTFDPSGANLNLVPEPSTYALMALGGLVLFFIARRRKAQV